MIQTIKRLGKSIVAKKQNLVAFMVAAFAVMTGTSCFAAGAGTANSGNSSVDKYLDGFIGVFSVSENGFVYLALGAIPVTIAVVLFFWLRGKAKQAINGA